MNETISGCLVDHCVMDDIVLGRDIAVILGRDIAVIVPDHVYWIVIFSIWISGIIIGWFMFRPMWLTCKK